MAITNRLMWGSLVLAGTLAAAGCGGGGSGSDSGSGDSNTGEASVNYNGPGSKWDVALHEDGSFDITRRETPLTPIDLTVSGSYQRLDSGYLQLVVEEATGTDAPVAGDQAWALEVPGYAFLLKPMDGDQVIAMVTAGSCPDGDLAANWVMVKGHSDSDASSDSRDYFGTFEFDSSTGTPSLPTKHALTSGFPLVTDGGIDGSGTCEDGLMLVGEEPDIAAMYLTENGGAIVQTNINSETDSSFIFGLTADAVDGSDLDGDFAGMLFDDNMSDGTQINPVAFSCSGSVCEGYLVEDIETGAASEEGVTITFSGSLSDNFVTGVIQDSDSNSGNLACMVDLNANDTDSTIASCVGQSPGDNSKMFNVLLVSK
ncbi:MAG: hypothetical protein R3175_08140 [Marinobacter sp.]|uniref:hypothetical protein n=1 Tax=Marinobacter sp. TaxID=50741 RepID=UPI00299DF278|nr:hypothetical protein [Marinobacter sp.]MDX1756010.1 hypothetical protein [Marinobacter sp.]